MEEVHDQRSALTDIGKTMTQRGRSNRKRQFMGVVKTLTLNDAGTLLSDFVRGARMQRLLTGKTIVVSIMEGKSGACGWVDGGQVVRARAFARAFRSTDMME